MPLIESTHTCLECGQEWSSDENEYCPECGTHYNENPGNLETEKEDNFSNVKNCRSGTGLDLSKLNIKTKSLNIMEKKLISWTCSVGNYGKIEIDIHIGMSNHVLSEDDKKSIHNYCREINKFLINKIYENDEKLKIQGEKEKQELIDLFKNHSLIFVKEILNQYDGSIYPGYSKHFPWLEITTTIGTFTIGWRKKVIQIDWSNTIINFEAKHIFPDEDVTKGEKYIHAWGIEKAQEYIDKIFGIISGEHYDTNVGQISKI